MLTARVPVMKQMTARIPTNSRPTHEPPARHRTRNPKKNPANPQTRMMSPKADPCLSPPSR